MDETVCHKSLAESSKTQWAYIFHPTFKVYSGGSETATPQSFWMEIIIHRIDVLAVNNDCLQLAYNCWASNDCWYVIEVSINRALIMLSLTPSAMKGLHCHLLLKMTYWFSIYVKKTGTCWLPHPRIECQRTVNNVWSCILDNPWAVQWH